MYFSGTSRNVNLGKVAFLYRSLFFDYHFNFELLVTIHQSKSVGDWRNKIGPLYLFIIIVFIVLSLVEDIVRT